MTQASTSADANLSAAIAPRRRAGRGVRRFVRHRLALAGFATVIVLAFAAGVGPYLNPYNDLHIDILHRFTPPFAGPHVLGTDSLGRDMLARLEMAGRVSLTVGCAAMVISTIVGTVVGVLAGYYGGIIGSILMRFVDAVLCFPSIFLLLALAAFVQPTLLSITLIIAASGWMEVARQVEAQIRSLRDRDFAVAALALGASDRMIMFRELIPNAIAPIVVAATLNVARAILLESYISFLGYGIQPPTPSWGNMLNNAQEFLATAPWLAIFPGAAITLAVTGFNFLGDGLRDALDPRLDVR
jgi:peptide/nickel transport system permease protein